MPQVVTFGEVMLRLSPPGYTRLMQTGVFEATYGGAEANVAVALSNLGLSAGFVSKLPDNPLGRGAVNALRSYGVDTRFIQLGGPRIGIYYCEKGASQRPSAVVYDRAGSSVSLAQPGEFDWDTIFEGCEWFHFTGITPALSPSVLAITEEACRAAKARGITVSCDLNYRKKLWSREQAREAMSRLMDDVDVLIANEEDAHDVFGIQAGDSDVDSGRLSEEGYTQVARELNERFGFKMVAITLRRSITASDNAFSGMLYTDGKAHFAKEYDIHIVDRVGGGDSFGAGLIHAALHGKDPQAAVDYATALSCLKHSVEGDFSLISAAEVDALLKSGGSGRIQR